MHGELSCYIVVACILHNGRAADRVRQCRNIRARRIARRQAAYRVGVAIYGKGQGLKACRTLLSAVIGVSGIALRNYGDLVLLRAICNLQRAFGLVDCIVVRQRACVEVIAECVRTFANRQLAAGKGVSRAFAGYPARLCGQSRCAVRQSRAVVFFLQIRGFQRHCAFRDLQRPVSGMHGELSCYIVVACILHNGRAADRVRQCRNIRARRIACRQAAYSVGVALYGKDQGLKTYRALLGAVVGVSGIALRNYGDLVLLFTIRNRQCAGNMCSLNNRRINSHSKRVVVVGGITDRPHSVETFSCRSNSNSCTIVQCERGLPLGSGDRFLAVNQGVLLIGVTVAIVLPRLSAGCYL